MLRTRLAGRWSGALLAALLGWGIGGCVHRNPRPGNVPADDPFGPLEWMVSPTQGRPALLKVGGRLPVMFRVPAGFAGRVEFRLQDAVAGQRANGVVPLALVRELEIASGPVGPAAGSSQPPGEPLAFGVLTVPDYAEPGLYDLFISLSPGKGRQPPRARRVPRAVALYDQFPSSFRFVQLSNMNAGGHTAADFSDELVEEVNRIAPEFIITTGDYTEQASARDDAESWRRIKRYFARFDAPVFLVAGDLDHDASFHTYVAPSKSGQFFFGPCHGILLHDNYRNPIDRDDAQVRWLDSILQDAAAVSFHFLVSPNDSLRIFDAWRKLGHAPADYVQRHRIGMIFVGGYSDWDFVEHGDRLAGVPVHYIRTHASSTAIRGKATGVPHYRIVQVEQLPAARVDAAPSRLAPTRVSYLVPEDGPVQHAQHSVPVGRLKVAFDGPNDGSAERLKVTVLNRLTVPIGRLRVKLHLKRSNAPVACVGGRIERVIDLGQTRQVWLRTDCPDLGVVSAMVGPATALPGPPPGLTLQLLGDPVLHYRPARTADGFGYYLTDGNLQLRLTNSTGQVKRVWPVIRLNGNVLSLRDMPAGQPVVLAGGEERTMPVHTPLALAAPGEHWLTVHLADDPLPFLTSRPVQLVILPADKG